MPNIVASATRCTQNNEEDPRTIVNDLTREIAIYLRFWYKVAVANVHSAWRGDALGLMDSAIVIENQNSRLERKISRD
jgi:hypothetical protein